MDKKSYIKGIFCGVLIPVVIVMLLALFNIGHVGTFFQSTFLLKSKSLESLSFSQKVEGAIEGMIGALDDPYSYYLEPEEFTSLMEEVSGTYVGIGIYLLKEEGSDYVSILAPIKGTPAFNAGLEAGDVILTLDGKSMKGKTADIISNKIKTKDEKTVVLEILRNGETMTFRVDKTDITIPTVEGEYLPNEDGLAYISISQFNNTTPVEMDNTLLDLTKQGEMKGIILDLRNNPGGSVPAVEQVAEMFIPNGKEILWILEKKEETSITSKNSNPLAVPVVILVNKNSASASEVLAGALKDNNVATLIGETTFGKGIIQTVFALRDGGAVKITTARYLSPNRTEIHEVGIVPDVEVPLDNVDKMVLYSKDATKDNQLAAAIAELKEKMGQ